MRLDWTTGIYPSATVGPFTLRVWFGGGGYWSTLNEKRTRVEPCVDPEEAMRRAEEALLAACKDAVSRLEST